MEDYCIRIVSSNKKLSPVEIEQRVNDFQQTFIRVAARYYGRKHQEKDGGG